MEFIQANGLYIGLAVASGLALLWPLVSRGSQSAVNVSPTEAVLLMNRTKTLVLDVRDAEEFATGHIQGAKNIPLSELENRVKEIEKFKSKTVLVHCQKGMRSNSACKMLSGHAFTELHQLGGGLDKWIEAKMPLVKV